jgi:hypothetical protein
MPLDVILSDARGQRLLFPMNPLGTIDAGSSASITTYHPIELGTIERPRGEEPYVVRWSGMLPGASRQVHDFVKQWQPPNDIAALLDTWRKFGVRLLLTVTTTPINLYVFIARFDYKAGQSGYGDLPYEIELHWDRDFAASAEPERVPTAGVTVSTAPSDSATSVTDTGETLVPEVSTTTLEGGGERPESDQPATADVAGGDSLWLLAQRELGDGSRWREIYALNQDAIGSNPDVIYAGTTLTLPGK